MAKTKPFLPTLNEIRSAQAGGLKGHAVAEAFDQISSAIKALHDQISTLKPSSTTNVTQTNAAASASSTAPQSGANSGSVPFGSIASGTNGGADMIVAAGGTLDYTGVGIINASSIAGVTVTGTPSAGFFLIATSPSTAGWMPLGMISAIDCMNPASYRGGIDCGSLA